MRVRFGSVRSFGMARTDVDLSWSVITSEPGRGWYGTTVVLVPDGAVAAVDVRGGVRAPGRRMHLTRNLVDRIHGLCLTGQRHGLAAADGELQRRRLGVPACPSRTMSRPSDRRHLRSRTRRKLRQRTGRIVRCAKRPELHVARPAADAGPGPVPWRRSPGRYRHGVDNDRGSAGDDTTVAAIVVGERVRVDHRSPTGSAVGCPCAACDVRRRERRLPSSSTPTGRAPLNTTGVVATDADLTCAGRPDSPSSPTTPAIRTAESPTATRSSVSRPGPTGCPTAATASCAAPRREPPSSTPCSHARPIPSALVLLSAVVNATRVGEAPAYRDRSARRPTRRQEPRGLASPPWKSSPARRPCESGRGANVSRGANGVVPMVCAPRRPSAADSAAAQTHDRLCSW